MTIREIKLILASHTNHTDRPKTQNLEIRTEVNNCCVE